ncbi:MAG TPA: glycoside hydrolase family 15 protein [Lacipirellulaceae bacterium]
MQPKTQNGEAFGKPGIEPRWTRGDKDAIGTAYSASSRLWFTLAAGIVNEVYFPTIDRPQIRDLQYLVTDGESFVHDERRHLKSTTKELSNCALGYQITNTDPDGRYQIEKQVITDPHYACLLIQTRVEANESIRDQLRLFALLAPHLGSVGWGNSGRVYRVGNREIFLAHNGNFWLAMAATTPFLRCSCGYVGRSDGWTDLFDNLQMDWEFAAAEDGNIALTGELNVREDPEFTLGLALGYTRHNAVTTLLQALGVSFAEQRERYIEQWGRAQRNMRPVQGVGKQSERLYGISHSLLLAHEDKTYAGAMIASMSIPWGEAAGDDNLGGYHLVWTRDMVNSATGLLATGNIHTPLRALIYLACSQRPDGSFHQNFWIDGEPYWQGIQLDEVAFPVMLAWRLHEAKALRDFDPYPMVLRAAAYLICNGPATQQERWEEASGYSPSTLASNIAALTCAAAYARERGDRETAQFVQEYADFLEAHVEAWTVTTEGSLLPDVRRHFIRINPADPGNSNGDKNPNQARLVIRNRAPGQVAEFPAKDIVDAGFLELVRYGIRKAGDPLFEDSLRVVDALLKVETPYGPCWRRYNHDGYGQRVDGGPYYGFGKGRAWPLLTGERGHYELAAGGDPEPYLRAMERFACCGGLLPEQIWDEPDRPQQHLFFGKPTGSATPLLWAHAEYVKLLRSMLDGRVFDSIPVVVDRYSQPRRHAQLELWKPNRRVAAAQAPSTLRIQATSPFLLHWTADEWQSVNDTRSTSVPLGIEFVDIPIPATQRAPIRFTFFWPSDQRWEGADYSVTIRHEVTETSAAPASDSRPAAHRTPSTALAGV